MNSLQRLVIGYIPENCKSEYITPFNPDQSETVETCIELKDKKFYFWGKHDGDTELTISYDDLWDPSSKMWELFVDKFCNQLSTLKFFL